MYYFCATASTMIVTYKQLGTDNICAMKQKVQATLRTNCLNFNGGTLPPLHLYQV